MGETGWRIRVRHRRRVRSSQGSLGSARVEQEVGVVAGVQYPLSSCCFLGPSRPFDGGLRLPC